jgi:hypothetical protein
MESSILARVSPYLKFNNKLARLLLLLLLLPPLPKKKTAAAAARNVEHILGD